jgi:hypothetical protein
MAVQVRFPVDLWLSLRAVDALADAWNERIHLLFVGNAAIRNWMPPHKRVRELGHVSELLLPVRTCESGVL